MTKKKKGIVLMSVGVLILIASGVFYYFYSPQEPRVGNTISVDVYIQDKKVAATSDCAVTEKVSVTIPEASNIADASLTFLFEEELEQYGEYERVDIAEGVAKVFLKSNTLPSGAPLGSLSSCQIGHLTSVLQDTLTQYGEVEFVELHSPEGKIEF